MISVASTISIISIVSTSVIVILIAGYVGFVIYRNVRKFKEGRFCSGGCENCPDKTNKTKDSGYNIKK